ncbi:MAG TPA: hypothetical protein VFU00_07315, partial [Gemmatimonadales bacterium]|nr:hypothetical protein [Gemmatimonadales bacterium]
MAPPALALPALTLTIFGSAFLLFLLQPMFSRMVLPLMGGGAAVWNTCVLFFQLALLAGYLYAHVATRRLARRWQMGLHLALLVVSLALLPIRLRLGAPPAEAEPVGWLLLLLTLSISAPFFLLSTTSPLLQRWLASSRHPAAADPYFLYAASNAGSLLALLAYPVVVEPWLTLAEQRTWWSIGYAGFVGLVGVSALAVAAGAA